MNKIKTIFKYEFLTAVKRKSFIIMTIAFPLLGLIVIGGFHIIQGISEETPSEEIKIGYVDEVGIFDSNLAYGNIILVPEEDQTKAFEDMVNGEISQYIVIPQDYLNTGNIARYTLERELDVSSEVYSAIERFLVGNILIGQVDDSIIERVASPFYINSITLTPEGQAAEQQGGFTSFIVPYIFSLLLVMSIFTSSGFLLQGLGEEKENRVMEILTFVCTPRELFTGKVLGLGVAGLRADCNMADFRQISCRHGIYFDWRYAEFAFGIYRIFDYKPDIFHTGVSALCHNYGWSRLYR